MVIQELTATTQTQSATNNVIGLLMKIEVVVYAVADIPSGQKFYKKEGIVMKKVLILTLTTLSMCLLFTACKCEHQYEEKITTSASCTTAGIKTFTCAKCNDSYIEEIPIIAHDFGAPTLTKEPTCTTEGEKSTTCSVCGETKVTESVAKLEHSYISSIVSTSTCTTEGTKSFTCSECNHSYSESIPKANHNYTSKVTTPPTCIAKGVETYTCKNCSHSFAQNISATGHDYSLQIIEAATCISSGKHAFTCKDCGYSYTEVVEIEEHNWVSPTCTTDGYCSGCGMAGDEAKGHYFGSSEGLCIRCGTSNINIPDAPLSYSVYNGAIEITNIDAEIYYHRYTEKHYVTITITGQLISSKYDDSHSTINYKLYDSEGFVVASGGIITDRIGLGDKFVADGEDSLESFSYYETYTLVLV